ncbi:unnamed protein product [Clavelina lepadiformis]|uniref:Uncharacterized protein n=1 Tax=Clavelina lepadiformis TaxID=159417 RepID=A0ABP0G7E9_CLALP
MNRGNPVKVVEDRKRDGPEQKKSVPGIREISTSKHTKGRANLNAKFRVAGVVLLLVLALRQVIRERDRRNALDPEEVARVMKNPLFHEAALEKKRNSHSTNMQSGKTEPKGSWGNPHVQRTSAVRNVQVEELNHGYKTKKRRWIIRVKDHKTSAKYGDASIVMPGWQKEGLDKLVQFNGGAYFFEFLMGHDGGAHEESMARDRVHLLRNIIKDCEFENLQSFNIEDYKKKHVQKLQKEKKTPATFISHSNAMTNFLNFAILKKLALSFNVGESLLNLKNRRASYRKSLKKRRQLIRERDRRNALDPEEVARVMKNPIFHKTALATKLWEKDPGAEIRRAHGEILMAFLIIQNSQRTSAVRNMLVDELRHGYKTKKQRWIVRVQDHKTSATYGDATIVMPGWLKEGLDNLVQFNGGTCEIVFPHQGKALTSSAAAKVLQRVWKLAGGRGKFTATSNRKHSATLVVDLYCN